MTAGRGNSHSERSTAAEPVLHGAQLWVALPHRARFVEPRFDHHAPVPVEGAGWRLRVFLGTLAGAASPVATHTPLLGAELLLEPGAQAALAVDPAFEHGLLVDQGEAALDGVLVPAGRLAYRQPGAPSLALRAGSDGARALLLGGPPFAEEIVMWWNFLARSHEEILEFRAAWQREIAGLPVAGRGGWRFGLPADDPDPPLAAPPAPAGRVRPRRAPGAPGAPGA